ncbi:phospholipid carrier-dependent glycosyltransferase [Altericroceibacterium spongiae]|uniref:Polyprenol-phosphate-mannose--protein mannosyltransferase n=1 Tax=Altericroceibacterium spongiae TaxID=2320269 RepID=A0A420EMM6_9SPHN|nr:phospholipid carrier-dependent glycosyltransferase [Altericroceibacterium spongiae]RKF21864.1 phospholipid carrier-dependent glycosyltransferase [Altericroceibacterium spongiae]
MNRSALRERGPVLASLLLTLAFGLLCFVRLATPSTIYFDETYYPAAARAILHLSRQLNPEHPMVGKELIAAGIALYGNNAFGWRFFPALFGTLALFAAMRALWFATLSRFATLAGGWLLATGFMLFVQSRIAMLDIFMVCFVMIALWMCAAAMREAERARWRLIIAGIALGCAMGSKWNAVPVAILPGVAFLAIRAKHAGWRVLFSTRGAPIPGISLAEATLWLGLLPLAVYWLTYWPAFLMAYDPVSPWGFIGTHRHMIALQESTGKLSHPYRSEWYQWVLNLKPIWYLYREADGAQRGIFMVGNPLTMLIGLPALLWCVWAGLFRDHRAALAVSILYAASLGLWVIAPKPVQFYFHYLLPGCFLLAALAIALDRLWQAGWRKVSLAVLAASAALFAFFYPILSAAPLAGEQSFRLWNWLPGWV